MRGEESTSIKKVKVGILRVYWRGAVLSREIDGFLFLWLMEFIVQGELDLSVSDGLRDFA